MQWHGFGPLRASLAGEPCTFTSRFRTSWFQAHGASDGSRSGRPESSQAVQRSRGPAPGGRLAPRPLAGNEWATVRADISIPTEEVTKRDFDLAMAGAVAGIPEAISALRP